MSLQLNFTDIKRTHQMDKAGLQKSRSEIGRETESKSKNLVLSYKNFRWMLQCYGIIASFYNTIHE
jgi:hypothetical protein